MDFERQKPISDDYRDNWAQVFGKKPEPEKKEQDGSSKKG